MEHGNVLPQNDMVTVERTPPGYIFQVICPMKGSSVLFETSAKT
jgi:hypothetical protein